jgi:hypothetical protein
MGGRIYLFFCLLEKSSEVGGGWGHLFDGGVRHLGS